ncbi:MAG: hypothetical protein E7425_05890 [Ruminococcaceae bacterium]|nr:hypothetical protein [Oscillospiraceae bacterium]
MDRREIKKLGEAVKKYRYALAAILLGSALLLLPAHSARQEIPSAPETERGVEREIETTLAAFDGAGRLRLTLTVAPGTERWEGAVVVCEGADNASVRLALTQALRSLTGLSADRITIVKGSPED